MVAYWKLRYAYRGLPEERRKTLRLRAIEGLKRLRDHLAATLPVRTAGQTLLLGTWNIRNFDDNRFGHGHRLEESFFYIAEIVSAFDILAVQEIGEDLTPFERLMDTLGPDYDYIMTDVTLGDSGNRERLGFVFNRNKVSFTGVAGELVLPFEQQISDVTKQRQFARTPFSCTFQSAWFKFNFSTVHIYFGTESKSSPQYKRRVAEIDAVARFIAKRAKTDRNNAHILVGDFNIEDFEGKTFDALKRHGFDVFRNKDGSNATRTKFYDQISFLPETNMVTLANPDSGKAHGIFDFFADVFRDTDHAAYDDAVIATLTARRAVAEQERAAAAAVAADAGRAASTRAKAARTVAAKLKAIADLDAQLADAALRADYFRNEWRTFQMSDHFPLFVELHIDFAAAYLERIRAEIAGPPPLPP